MMKRLSVFYTRNLEDRTRVYETIPPNFVSLEKREARLFFSTLLLSI